MSSGHSTLPGTETTLTIPHQAYIAIVGVSLATGYLAGRCIPAVNEHAGKPSASSRNETKAAELDGDDLESDASSEAGDGDLAQVKPSLEEECKLVGVQRPGPLLLVNA